MEDQEFEEILTYLSKSKYPESINTKDSRSNWRKKCRPFTFCKNKLYYNHKKYGALMVVKGAENKKNIIETNHIQADGLHTGINKTLRKIISSYYWKTTARDVHNYIKIECLRCIKQSLQQKKPNNVSHDIENSALKSAKKIVDKAIEQIGVDVIGEILEPSVGPTQESTCSLSIKCETAVQADFEPLILRAQMMAQCGLDVIGPVSETHKGMRFIVILTDSITKWVEAKALREFTTGAVGDFIAEVMCRHGQIEEIHSKYGNDFSTRLKEKVCSIMGITVQMSNIPSQSNGYIENYWFNNLLCGALLKYSNQNQYYWDIYLNQVILAYRTFLQKNNTYSPFQLLYDRPVRLPAMGLAQPSAETFPDEQEALLCHMNNYIKSLSCPTQQQSLNGHDSENSSYLPQNTCIINSQHQSPQVLESYTQNCPTNNSISNANIAIVTSLGPTLQTTVHNNPQVTALSNNSNLTVQANVSANSMTSHNLSGTNMNTHTISVNNLDNHTISTNALPSYTISANNVANTNVPSTNPIITTQTCNHVMTSQGSVTPSGAVQPQQTHLTTQANADAHSGSMVMIHTDGKAYTDSFYVICPQ